MILNKAHEYKKDKKWRGKIPRLLDILEWSLYNPGPLRSLKKDFLSSMLTLLSGLNINPVSINLSYIFTE